MSVRRASDRFRSAALACIAFIGIACGVAMSWGADEDLPVALAELREVMGKRIASTEGESRAERDLARVLVSVEVRPLGPDHVTVQAMSRGPVFVAQDAIVRIAERLVAEGLLSSDEFDALSGVQGLRALEEENELVDTVSDQLVALRDRRAAGEPPPYRTRIEYVD